MPDRWPGPIKGGGGRRPLDALQGVFGRLSNRIINEVHGINRVVYDISGKPPATIEWELTCPLPAVPT